MHRNPALTAIGWLEGADTPKGRREKVYGVSCKGPFAWNPSDTIIQMGSAG
jgi:hypothetical protein